VCLGYPFHPPKQPHALRTAHLLGLTCPTLIVQGERDPFGGVEEVATYGLPPSIAVAWARDGDHDLAPRRSSGVTLEDNLAMAAGEIARFAERCAQTV
jgi:predicted alpha/beta-hydrolase family hydrolase